MASALASCLWFDGDTADAARFHTALFVHSTLDTERAVAGRAMLAMMGVRCIDMAAIKMAAIEAARRGEPA